MAAEPSLPYERWIEEAMRSVVRRALESVATGGLPGQHHFYISFATGAAGVKLADELRARYPDDMTIVLQHQFWDLLVAEDRFEVTLKFRGRLQRLVVPFAAVTGFVDPSVNFALQFRAAPGGRGDTEERRDDAQPQVSSPPDQPESDAGEVIALDRFRKK